MSISNTKYDDLKEVKQVLSSASFSLRDKLNLSLTAGIFHLIASIIGIASLLALGIVYNQPFFQNVLFEKGEYATEKEEERFFLFVILYLCFMGPMFCMVLFDYLSKEIILFKLMFKQRINGYDHNGEIAETNRVTLLGNRVIAVNFSNLKLKKIDKLLTLPNVKYVDLSHNHIKKVNLKISNSIEILDLSHNKIEKLIRSLDEVCGHVLVLNLSNNELIEIPEFRYRRLEVLNLSSNKIAISPGFIYLEELMYLDMSNNNLKKARDYSLPNLRILNLRNNEIVSVNGGQNLPHLKEIYLDDNPVIELRTTRKNTTNHLNSEIKQFIASNATIRSKIQVQSDA